ncbi:MAG: hypothetical protein IJZ64_01285 [Ruminococcus sp.]|nr:hypothetical protein [Ruminococcus sp.]
MDRKTCFIVCPIGEEGSEIRRKSDDLLEFIIEPICNQKGYDIVRADKILNNDRIDDSILKYLNEAELVIADVTQNNANVFYELGFRTATGKPVIQIAEDGTKLPFDIQNIRTHFYNIDNTRKTQEFKQKLLQIIYAVEQNEEKKKKEENQKQINEVFTSDFQRSMSSVLLTEMVNDPEKFERIMKLFDDSKKAKSNTTT